MDFIEFKSNIESELQNMFQFELIELRYLPYSFGSGFVAYRIKGKVVKFIFDGKDNWITITKNENGSKYPTNEKDDNVIFKGLSNDIKIIKSILQEI